MLNTYFFIISQIKAIFTLKAKKTIIVNIGLILIILGAIRYFFERKTNSLRLIGI